MYTEPSIQSINHSNLALTSVWLVGLKFNPDDDFDAGNLNGFPEYLKAC